MNQDPSHQETSQHPKPKAFLGAFEPGLDPSETSQQHDLSRACQFCHWTNVGTLNIGEPGAARWICHGCVKRIVDARGDPAAAAQRQADRMAGHRRPAILEAETICPICFTSYNLHDAPEEWLRVVNALCNPDGVNPRASLLQAAHWLRAGAPGRALATIEAALAQGENHEKTH